MVLLFTIQPGFAQSDLQGRASGAIKDDTGKPVGFATVTLLKAADSALVKGVPSDSLGHYEFDHIAAGKYLVAASLLGMGKAYTKPFRVDAAHENTSLPLLMMSPDAKALKGVSVTAVKPMIEHELDKTIVNVSNSIVSAGSTALEVLEKSPGIAVDNNDNITLNGKSGVTIMIDDKPTYLSQQEIATMLKTMNAGNIDKIEIMTNPSAKYDAAGTAGIINIKLKKNKDMGWNGSVTAGFGQGHFARENAGANLNYRKGKINLYGNYNYSHGKWWNTNVITRNFYDGFEKALSSRFEQNADMNFPSDNHSFKAGIDYAFNKNNTIGIMMNGTVNPGSSHILNTTRFKSPDGTLDSTAVSNNNSNDKWNNFTYDLNYKHVFDTSGREITADLDYAKFANSSLQDFRTDYYDANGNGEGIPLLRRGDLPANIDIRSGKIDYVNPLKHNAKIEAGLKSSYVVSDNNVRYLNYENGGWVNDANATNHFKYTENINAGYINFNQQFKKGWGLQLGLRGEQTVSKGEQLTIDSTVNKNYFQLFPSAFLSKELDKNNQLSFSYSRRIDRPDYQDLNPFRFYLDPYTYQEGNVNLQPQLTNSFELSYMYKHAITVSLNYSQTHNVMTDVLKQIDSLRVTYQTKENLSTLNNLGLSISAPIPVTKWWMSNNYFNVFYNQYQGIYLGAHLDYGKASYMFNTTNTFKLPQGFTAELSGFYRSPFVYGIITGQAMYMASVGLQKSFWHQKANLKLNVNDVFNTRRFAGEVKFQNIDVTVKNRWDSRVANLTFTYRFGKAASKPEQQKTGIEEEQNRVKKGNGGNF